MAKEIGNLEVTLQKSSKLEEAQMLLRELQEMKREARDDEEIQKLVEEEMIALADEVRRFPSQVLWHVQSSD